MTPFDARAWNVCARWGCRDEFVSAAADPFTSRMWLRGFKGDHLRMNTLRALLARETPCDMSRLSDDQVVDGIAGLLMRGRLHVHAKKSEPVANMAKPVDQPPASPDPLAAHIPRQPRTQTFPRLVQPPMLDRPTFPPNVNMLAQAAALVAAVAAGAPFCPI